MSTLNIEQFQRDVLNASMGAIEQFRADFPNTQVCGFALYSDADARTLAPSFNTQDHLTRVEAEYPDEGQYFKWSPAEWSHEAYGGEFFNDLSKMLWNMADATTEINFLAHRRHIFEQCVIALKKLTTTFDTAIYVFSVSDFECGEDEIAWVTALNTPDQADEFRTWME
ncbi:DUF4303 domain-containing protein [Pseudomonas petrae]|uniref:DUF4303 domain-containing protein n=1 Tax=Pseudomonas petrae TaxID=2912190 RepID=A0ABS9I632_9PSED|nr:DUF4303 domain-containing protein [Pseudomonas petrae]MCF7532922.1 DUF4303 domain-containing protein [Pseudomonas petrae]MCF7535722.1 DUF4303 domain-containing protein [Pseudomonas petrae]MCF7543248.1 DUF4303 domain-containing protein [Pseudomonas petrae]MCF7554784.1 DUF4303 domain-containing protein [Pseudomonas petrae]